MLKVHIWPPAPGLVGHASISFETTYVSFWPEGRAGKVDLKIKRSHPGAFISALQDDIRSEGGRQPMTVGIKNYDRAKLARHIADLIENAPRYQLARNNCSHVVARCLEVACEKSASFVPNARDYSRAGKLFGCGIWTPNDVLRYAKELAK